MSNEETVKRTIVSFTPEFKRNLRQLAKKYRQIKDDIQPLLDELEIDGIPGNQVPGVQFVVYLSPVSEIEEQMTWVARLHRIASPDGVSLSEEVLSREALYE